MRIKKLNIVDGGRWKNGINAISHHENYGRFSLAIENYGLLRRNHRLY